MSRFAGVEVAGGIESPGNIRENIGCRRHQGHKRL
jgi:hypothetical protein